MAVTNFFLHENASPVWAIEPKNYTGAAATTFYGSLKNYNSVCFLIQTGAWAAGTAAVTLAQATAVAGTATKALAFAKIWTKTSTDDLPTEVTVTSNTFNLDTANKLYIIEVKASDLDLNNGFDVVGLAVATPGANADVYGAIAIFTSPRFAQKSPPTVLTD